MVDTFRQFASNKSGEVLTWNKYFAQEQDNQEVTLLAAKEVHRLEFYQAQSERLRQDYILLLRNLCLNVSRIVCRIYMTEDRGLVYPLFVDGSRVMRPSHSPE